MREGFSKTPLTDVPDWEVETSGWGLSLGWGHTRETLSQALVGDLEHREV